MDRNNRYIVKVSYKGEQHELTATPTTGAQALNIAAAWAKGVAVGADAWVTPLGTNKDDQRAIGHYEIKNVAGVVVGEVWALAV